MHQTNPYWLVSQAPEDLKAQIRLAVQYGYHVTSQTDTTAQLLRHKKFSLLFAVLWFLVFGVGILVYVIYYAAKRDDAIYLDLNTQPKKEGLEQMPKPSSWQAMPTSKKIAYGLIGVIGVYLIVGFVARALHNAQNSQQLNTTSTAMVISPDTVKTLLQDELEAIKTFDGEGMRKLQEEKKKSPELETFDRWGELVAEGKKSTDAETVELAKKLEKQASAIQVKEFPLMRKISAEQFKQSLWKKDVGVNVSGSRFDTLEFVSFTFGRNQNISDFYTPLAPAFQRLRYRSVLFRSYEGSDGTRFDNSKLEDFPKDGDVVKYKP